MNDRSTLGDLLRRDPDDIEALVEMGADLRRRGDERGASACFTEALRAAARRQPLPILLRPAIERAQAALRQSARLFEDYLEAALTHAGFDPAHRSARFQMSLDILTGRRSADMGRQRPGTFFFPGLDDRGFFERRDFPWSSELEGKTDLIRQELDALNGSEEDRFRPYLASERQRFRRDFHGLLDNPDWSSLYLYDSGRPQEENVALAPLTFEALQNPDLPFISVRAPVIMFSRLKSGARIQAHTGAMNARLICHLPLHVPSGCGFRVGPETRSWEEGKLLIFNDTIEHEAWNDGPADRTLLIFDVWHPGLNPDERLAISALFQAVDAFRAA